MSYQYELTVKDLWLRATGKPVSWKHLVATMRQGIESSSPMGACFDVIGLSNGEKASWVIFEVRLESFKVKESK